MAKLVVVENFQFRGALRVRDNYLEISDKDVVAEIKEGKHEESGKWNSGLLNHCDPADEHTRDLIAGKAKPQLSEEEARRFEMDDAKEKEIKRLRGEFDKLGMAFSPKWAMDKLQKELKNAKRKAGAAKELEPKTDKV